MSAREIIVIYSSIIFAIILDGLISFKLGSVFFDTNFSYLIFSYWVFAAPEKIRVSQSILIGFLVDFLSNSEIGFHITLYCLFSLIIHAYAYTFRLFSYLQLAIFFGTSASFISALFYLPSPTALLILRYFYLLDYKHDLMVPGLFWNEKV